MVGIKPIQQGVVAQKDFKINLEISKIRITFVSSNKNNNTMSNFALVPTSMETSQPICGGFGNQPLEYTPWVYLHGSLENLACSEGGWDKFKWVGSAPTSEGVYTCTAIFGDTDFHRVSVTAFLWEVYGKLTGLVVADDDDEQMLYALKQFKAKSDFI